MNSSDRRHHIFLKVAANQQRRNREVLLKSLSPPLAEELGIAQCVYTPESHFAIARFLPIAASGIGSGTPTRPVDYFYTEVAYPHKVLTLIQKIDEINPNTRCYLSIDLVSSCYQGDEGYWIPKYPIFVVEVGWVQSVLSDLWSFANDCLAIVGCEFEFGAIVDHYCGYLENDYNSDEIVYEIAMWSNVIRT